MPSEGCTRPRFKAQLKNDGQVYVPAEVRETTGAVPGDYVTLEVVPLQEGHDEPYSPSHGKEAKQRMEEVDEIGQSTFNYYLPLWMKNFCEHLHLTRGKTLKNVNDIGPHGDGRKAIVFGAGPSLAETTEAQWAAFQRFDGIVVATNKALIPLLEHDIVPDWVVALDGEPVVMKSFLNPLVEECRGRIKFMGPTVLHPDVTEFILGWAEECYWGNPSMPSGNDSKYWNLNLVLELMNGIPTMHHGGNVGTCAWLLAKKLKCDPIAMYGFDLCSYPDPTWTRAKAVDFEYFYNPDNGETLALNAAFRAYVNILMGACDMGWNEEPPTRTVNITPRGALHMSAFFPNFEVAEFVDQPGDSIIARATTEHTEAVERLNSRLEAAREAQKPIFKDLD
jgi:bifunctional DNA-binding transcriptional regulator/antitoxin component of YhaV-PrlF toxin-antitoxin module